MSFKTVGRFNYSAITCTLLAFSLYAAASAADVDASLTFDDEIAVADFYNCFDEGVYCGEDDDIAAVDDCFDEGAYCGEDEGIAVVDDCFDEDEQCGVEGQDFSSLFEDLEDLNLMFIDTSFAWDNKTINSGRFDYKMLGADDTIRIPLVDSSQNKIYVHPFANYVTSRFGLRGYQWHYGIDVKLRTGDPVKCVLDGIVRAIQYDRTGYGNVVVVRHHNGIETLYGHLSKVSVKANQPIAAGEIVGLGGNTGRSTGSHLHFEIRYYGEAFNPEYIIDFDDYALKNDTLVLTRDNFEYLTEARKTVYYTVRSGDNLSSIAKRYGTTVSNLCRLNGITPQTILRVGRRLVVRSGAEAERNVVSNSPAQSPTNAQNTQVPAAQAGAAVSADVFYTVRSGDNLSNIAKRYGTTVSNLCRLNGITPQTTIKVGWMLVVSNETELRETSGNNPAEVSAKVQNTQSPAAKAAPAVSTDVYYTVRKGDTLGGIAKRYGTTVNNLSRLNGITPQATLRVGRMLVVSSVMDGR